MSETDSELSGAYSREDDDHFAYDLDSDHDSIAESNENDDKKPRGVTFAAAEAAIAEEGSEKHHQPQRIDHKKHVTINYMDFLSAEEISRADAVYEHVLKMSENQRPMAVIESKRSMTSSLEINFQQFQVALSLLGQQESFNKLNNMFLKELQIDTHHKGKETIDLDTFKRLIAELRLSVIGMDDHATTISRIRDAFDALYEGTCELDDQRDEYGEKYIYAKELRVHLTTLGNVLSDEEADELIKECHPIEVPNAEGVVKRRIYFEQFRSMLLDKGM